MQSCWIVRKKDMDKSGIKTSAKNYFLTSAQILVWLRVLTNLSLNELRCQNWLVECNGFVQS